MRKALKITGIVVLLIAALVCVYWVVNGYYEFGNRGAEKRVKEAYDFYGITLLPCQSTICVNNWLVIKGRVLTVYARDDNFNPIRCEML